MIYKVTYDLIESGKRYEKLVNIIKGEPAWVRLGGSSYLVDSDKTALELRDRYKIALDANDHLYIGVVKVPVAWAGIV